MMGRKIQGYAVEPHTVAVPRSGATKQWTPNSLRNAAHTLEGVTIYIDGGVTFNELGDAVGSVEYAEYIEGKGVRYEAIISDQDAISLLERGAVQPVPSMHHESKDPDQDGVIRIDSIEFKHMYLTDVPAECVPPLGRPGIDRNI